MVCAGKGRRREGKRIRRIGVLSHLASERADVFYASRQRIAVVKYISDCIYLRPQHHYTQKLLSAEPSLAVVAG
jgi:hypothetical protein